MCCLHFYTQEEEGNSVIGILHKTGQLLTLHEADVCCMFVQEVDELLEGF